MRGDRLEMWCIDQLNWVEPGLLGLIISPLYRDQVLYASIMLSQAYSRFSYTGVRKNAGSEQGIGGEPARYQRVLGGIVR